VLSILPESTPPPVFLVRPTGLRCWSESCTAARVAWVCIAVFFPLIDFAHRFPRRRSQNARLAPPRVFLAMDLVKRAHSIFRRRHAVRAAAFLGQLAAAASFSDSVHPQARCARVCLGEPTTSPVFQFLSAMSRFLGCPVSHDVPAVSIFSSDKVRPQARCPSVGFSRRARRRSSVSTHQFCFLCAAREQKRLCIWIFTV
jgi:hypothetical protein